MSTIYDVARLAGVSPKTVSRVLNGDGPVGDKTREAVETAMRDLGYVRSNAARMMRAQKSGIIGLITGGIDFSKLEWVLKPENPATEAVEKVAIQYGAFANTVIQFLIVAFVVFLLVKGINSLRRQEAAKPDPAPSAPTACRSKEATSACATPSRPTRRKSSASSTGAWTSTCAARSTTR